MTSLKENVHQYLPAAVSNDDKVEIYLTRGDYQYYHYGCDGVNDYGWGCGYRTLQSLASWIRKQQIRNNQMNVADVPSIRNIQELLSAMGDKESSFIGSKLWIGSVEVGLVLDKVYDTPCKIVHIHSGSELHKYVDEIKQHFVKFGCPIMMGGNTDNSSKGIMGLKTDGMNSSLLIVDPHFVGNVEREKLISEGFVHWRNISDFDQNSFYNLCMPQLKGLQ
ncbi:putative Ufm1-specific protease 1 [Tubulanus polymorphus]|uniref:putative Ufm1-specific protease 1 n=1 Tax=Tubulanus polymorphus TaxID=672921 RepID=UPI003DA49C5F